VKNVVEFYQDQAGEWRWRFIAAENGKILADGGQGYADVADATKALERVTRAWTDGFASRTIDA
jgi:uncharacterized protein YegP (UPF0339 family)